MFALCSLCVRSVFALCSLCVRSVFALCSLCVRPVFALCSLCVRSVFALCSPCVRSVFDPVPNFTKPNLPGLAITRNRVQLKLKNLWELLRVRGGGKLIR